VRSFLVAAVLLCSIYATGQADTLVSGPRPPASVLAPQTSAAGAAAALPANAPSHDQVMTLLDLMQVRKLMRTAVDSMKQAIATGAEEGLRHKTPNPTPKQIDRLHSIIDAGLEDLPLDEMVEAVVAVYQRHFTKTDVEELVRFYSSPVGQKVLHEQPQMMQESMQAGAEIQRKRYDETMLKIQKKIDQMMDEDEKDKTQAPKK
jgi:hypothetical protein